MPRPRWLDRWKTENIGRCSECCRKDLVVNDKRLCPLCGCCDRCGCELRCVLGLVKMDVVGGKHG